MSDLRRRLHAAAATPTSELDTESLTARAVRRRQRRAIAVAAAAAVVVIAGTGGALAARDAHRNDTLRTRGSDSETTLAPSTSAPSTSTSTSTSTTTATPNTDPTVPPTGGGPSWHASPITGIGNFADITITATELPNGTYYVGQCPKDLPDGASLSSCLVNDIVEVTDGNLTASVRALWWIESGRVDCGAAPGTCVVGFQSGDPGSTFTPVSFDLAFDPAKRPRIEVTPSTGLADGQQIEVRGFNIGAGTVSFAECITASWASCIYADAVAGDDGTFTAQFTVQRVLHWSYHGTSDESGECGVDGGCFIATWVTPKGLEPRENTFRMLIEPGGPVAIAFAPAPPTTTTAP